jgi:hypothetical protein
MYNSPEEIYIGEEEDSSFTAIESRAFATLLSLSHFSALFSFLFSLDFFFYILNIGSSAFHFVDFFSASLARMREKKGATII